jgi:transposase-like protein
MDAYTGRLTLNPPVEGSRPIGRGRGVNPQRRFVVDAVYEGGTHGDLRDDPLDRLVGVGNQGGFRYVGTLSPFGVRYCVLYSDLGDPDWPDRLDVETGLFTYYGDNKTPGSDLHGTKRGGNAILREIFHRLHLGKREEVPPIFIFTKGGKGREVVFRDLAAPGAPGLPQTEDLLAVWKTKGGQRFQNYRAAFTVLDVARFDRNWIEDVRRGLDPAARAPEPWLEWRKSGTYRPLLAPKAREHRTPVEQLPQDPAALALLEQIVAYYRDHPAGPYGFERCAAELFRLMQPNVLSLDLTRPWRDGGRDALGLYEIGVKPSAVAVEFALEAKCRQPSPSNSSGVRETSRLISRIRHRQFGVFVTTSCIGEQAYRELIEDAHPVIVMAGADIVRVLREHGLGTREALASWLKSLEEKLA